MDSLDENIFINIFLNCPNDLEALSLTCSIFNNIINNHHILKYILKFKMTPKLSEHASKINNMKLLKYATLNDIAYGDSCAIAATNGNIDILKFLIEIEEKKDKIEKEQDWWDPVDPDIDGYDDKFRDSIYYRCVHSAIGNDHVECFAYIYDKIESNNKTSTIKTIVRAGAIKCLRYLCNKEKLCIRYINIRDAIMTFGKEFLEIYKEKRYKFLKEYYQYANDGNKYDVIEYLYDNCCEIDNEILGNLYLTFGIKILEMHYNKYNELPNNLYTIAINKIDITGIKYLIECQCKITKAICNYAFQNGRTRIIKIFIKNGYEPSQKNFTEVIKKENFKQFKFLHRNRFNITDEQLNIINNTGQLKFIKYLYNNKFDISTAEDGFIRVDNIDGLKFLKENNIDFSINILQKTINNNSINCLKYLHENSFNILKCEIQYYTNVPIINYMAKN